MKRAYTIFFILFFSAIVASCAPAPTKNEKKILLVSISPYKTIVEKIAGDEFIVRTVVPSENNPHAYEPTPRQLQELRQGILWFRIGESFEKKVFPVLQEKNRDLAAIDLTEGISLLRDGGCKCHGPEDRHIWLSPKLLSTQITTIAKALSKHFPLQEQEFLMNAERLLLETEQLDTELKNTLSKAKNASFLVPHSAFSYFCNDYQITQISIELRGKDPTPKHLAQTLEKMTELNTKLGIAMPQHSNKGIELMGKKRHLHIHTIDPYAENCFHTMRLLAEYIAHPESP